MMHTPMKLLKNFNVPHDPHDSDDKEFAGFPEDAQKNKPLVQVIDKNIAILSRQRKQAQAKVQRIQIAVNDPLRILSHAQLKVYAKSLENAYTEYCDFHNKLTAVLSDDEMMQHEDTYAEFEEVYHEACATVESLIMEATKERNQPQAPQVIVQQQPLRAPIPTFDGRYENWPKFKATFLDVMAQSNDSDTIKLFHLDKALIGAAAGILDTKTLNENNYKHAWEILIERFENPRVIIDAHIRGLLSFKKMSSESHRELRQLLDECTRHVENLRYMKQQLTGVSELIIVYLLATSLDRNTRKQWEATVPRGELPKYEDTITFLKKHCNILENCESASQATSSRPQQPQARPSPLQKNTGLKSFAAAATSSGTSDQCDFCGEGHKNFQCELLKNLNVSQRVEKVRSLGMCFNCLRKGHCLKDCPSDRKCLKCHQRHHTQLHDDARSNRPQVEAKNAEAPKFSVPTAKSANSEVQASSSCIPVVETSPVTTTCSITKVPTRRSVLLLTAVVNLIDQQGKPHPCRVLLDCGSQVNIITKKMADTIGAQLLPTNVTISGVNNRTTSSMERTIVHLQSRCSSYRAKVECIVTPSVTGVIPSTKFDVTNWCIPPEFQLADPNFNEPHDINMLIGNGMFFQILKSRQHKLADHLPELRETHLGWVFTGEYQEVNQPKLSLVHTVTVQDVYDAVEKFWTIEEVPEKQAEEEACESHFRTTYHRDQSGRFVVQLPLKENIDQLSDCRSLALKRFYLLEQRLASNPALRQQYVQFIQEYEHLGHCKQINERSDPPNLRKCYLPHHAVIRPDSSSTKCRVVFDASAKPSKDAASLNDVLKVGGVVQSDLFSIVLRFRKHQYAFTADISKMYRQILVDPRQTSLQRIFWRESPDVPLKVYDLSTVTYGTASAPFLATRCLVQLANDGKRDYPLGSSTVKEDFYVDDVLSGDDSLESAIERQHQVKELLASAGFLVHKWCSNSQELLAHIPEVEREQQKCLDQQGVNAVIKVLGIMWNPIDDEFLFTMKPLESDIHPAIYTKRMILSEIAKLFDPLGFLSPVIVLAKILMQQTWQCKIGWDEPVNEEIRLQWVQLKNALATISQIRIPRRVIAPEAVYYELHGFADASKAAYGACVYVRGVFADGTAKLELHCSKSKVAPLNETTIPRLELCAALLLSRLVSKVLPEMKFPFQRVVLWSDSQIVLAWLRKSPEQLQVYVRNRVAEINEDTKDYSWSYVRSHENPADVVSRGQLPQELLKNELWWHGPEFLVTASYESMVPDITDEEVPELRARITVLPAKEEDLKLLSKYESFRKLQRIVALVKRFASNCKKKNPSTREFNSVPTIRELRNAEETILKLIQRKELGDEISRVKAGKPCKKIGALSPVLIDGLLRVGGRLEHSQLPFGAKHQVILPSKNPVTRMLIRTLHEEHLHLGPTGLVHVLRRNFWLIDAASTVRAVTRGCVKCFKTQPTDLSQYMGNLPSCRVNPAPPFSVTGVDYAGPFQIKKGNYKKAPVVKGYIAVFVCMVTRAVHLELVSDMSTGTFLAALQRFVGRRGIVHQMHSDNGTNFRGAHHELVQLHKMFVEEQRNHRIEYFCQSKGVEWHFIPPDAPEFGGIWEAAVKSTKTHLKRILGNEKLDFEKFATILAEIEAILNSRPLFITSLSFNDAEVITPAHYLIGRPLTAIPEPSYENIKANRLDLWQHLQMLREHFWKAWSRDYLSSLQPRKKNQKVQANVKPGMIVLVHNKNLPPLQWKLGQIVKTYPGVDGLVRAVDVYCDKTVYRRPITKLSILPIEDNRAYFKPPVSVLK